MGTNRKTNTSVKAAKAVAQAPLPKPKVALPTKKQSSKAVAAKSKRDNKAESVPVANPGRRGAEPVNGDDGETRQPAATIANQPSKVNASKRKRGAEPTDQGSKRQKRQEPKDQEPKDEEAKFPEPNGNRRSNRIAKKPPEFGLDSLDKLGKHGDVASTNPVSLAAGSRPAPAEPEEPAPTDHQPQSADAPIPEQSGEQGVERPKRGGVASTSPVSPAAGSPLASAEPEGLNQTDDQFQSANAAIPEQDEEQGVDQSVEQGEDASAPADQASDNTLTKAGEFLRVTASNVARHKLVRLMTYGYQMQIDLAAQIRADNAEIAKKQCKIHKAHRTAVTQQEGSEVEESMHTLREKHDKNMAGLEKLDANKIGIEVPLKLLNANHASRNNNLYGFHDIDRGNSELVCLPAKFWEALDRCYEAHAACNKIGQEISVTELERDNGMVRHEELIASVVYPKGPKPPADNRSAPATPHVQTVFDAGVRLKEFGAVSARLTALEEKLEDARDSQYREECALHGIAEEAFIAAGFLTVDSGVKEVELMRRIPSDDQEIKRPKAAKPLVLSSHQAELADEVKRTGDNLMDARRKLHQARGGPLTDASDMDSNAQGVARVQKMILQTHKVQVAEEEHGSVLRNAQNEGAISDENQWQNFKDHESDGYSDATLERQGCPMPEKKDERVDEWIADVTLHTAEVATGEAPVQHLADQMNWRPAGEEVSVDSEERRWMSEVNSLALGEDIELRAPPGGMKKLIDKMIAHTEGIRMLEKGEWAPEVCDNRSAMVKRPFENAENDIYIADPTPDIRDPSNGEQAESPRAAATQTQDLDDLENTNLEQRTVPADFEALCAALEKWQSHEAPVQTTVASEVRAVESAPPQRLEPLPDTHNATPVQNNSPVATAAEHDQRSSSSPDVEAGSLALSKDPSTKETQPDRPLDDPTSEIAEETATAAKDNHISEVSGLHASKEHNLLSAVLSLAFANRGVGYELETVEYCKGSILDRKNRIHDIERAEPGTVESKLPGLKSELKAWNEDLEHYYSRVEVMKERVVSACRNLDDVEARSSSDAPADGKEIELAMQCLAETEFWEDLDGYRRAKSSAEAIKKELDAVKQEQSAISGRTALLSKQFLDYRLKHGMSEDTAEPEDISPWYMPDLLLAAELAEQERNLVRALQTCFGLEQAQTVAISSERALLGAGWLRPRETSDKNGIGRQDGDAIPSKHVFDQLRKDLRDAEDERNATADAFDAGRYRWLTREELKNLPQPVTEEDKSAALIKKLQEHTRALMTAEEKYVTALQRALDARAVEPIAAKEDDETSHFSLDHSRDGTLPSSVRADMKAKARPAVDRWKVYDQERELPPLASGENAAIVFAVPANEKSLRSVSVGDPLPDAGPNYSNRIVEMRRRMDRIRSLEKGDLGPGNCEGRKMPKRPFDNATNDSPPAKRGRTDGPGDRNGRKSLKRPLDNTENDAENDFTPSKRTREDHNTSSCQQLAEDATGDPMDVDDPGDQPSSWTKPREQLPPGSWKENGMDGYDGENSGGFWSTQTLQAILDSRIDYGMDDYQGENMDGIE